MRILGRVIIFAVALIVVGGIGLVLYAVGPTTLRLMDRELLVGLPRGLIALSGPAGTLAERQVANESLRYREQFIAGADGDPPVRIVIVEPDKAAPGRPGIVDIHGGGFMYGSPESSLGTFAESLALELGATVVSVDYRLAPGTRYPGSLHDNYAALKWLHDKADSLGVDARRIALVGFSAGGAHAAMLSRYARDRGEVPILFQALLSPALDDRTGSTLDPGHALGRFLWTREDNRRGWTALLGVPAGSDAVPAAAVPMRETNLSSLPPTYIAVGALDLFATESARYAQKLKAAGVATEFQLFPGAFHGFEFIVPSARVSRQAKAALMGYMNRRFNESEATSSPVAGAATERF